MPPPVLSLPKYLLMSENISVMQGKVIKSVAKKRKYKNLTPRGMSALDMVKDILWILAAGLHLQLPFSDRAIAI